MTTVTAHWRKNFLKIHPYSVTLPSLAHAFTAIIQPFTNATPYCLWIAGTSGAYKTSFMRLVMALWGPQFAVGETFSWRSRLPQLEQSTYPCRHYGLTIDDFRMEGSGQDSDLPRKACMLIQNYGDQSGRGKLMRSETGNYDKMSSKYIRGSMFSVGEDIQGTDTAMATRCFTVPILQDGNTPRLAAAASISDCHAPMLVYFIKELIRKGYTEPGLLQSRFNSKLQWVESNFAGYQRSKNNLALNSVAWDLVAEIFEMQDLTKHYSNSLRAHAEANYAIAHTTDAAADYVEALRHMLQDGSLHLNAIKGASAPDGEFRSERLGWVSKDMCYILPSIALRKVKDFVLRTNSRHFVATPFMLYHTLVKEKILYPRIDKDGNIENLGQHWIEGQNRRVLQIPRAILLGKEGGIENEKQQPTAKSA